MADDEPTAPSLEERQTLAIDPGETYSPEKTGILKKARGGLSASARPESAPRSMPAFSLEKVVGRGGMGEVWEAKQQSLDRMVAVKRVRTDFGSSLTVPELQTMSRMFREEAFTTAFLDHPNIVPVHDLVFDPEGEPALVMKLVRGRPWNELIREDFDSLSPASYLFRHLRILIDVCHAVAFAHSQAIVHRDLKPSQVMVGEFGEVLLMDWGLAISLLDRREKRSLPLAPYRSHAPNPAGTFAFMAPEQTDDTAVRIGPWTDVFLLGGTLYSVLTGGRSPHESANSEALFEAARRSEIVPPEQRVPGRVVPEELSALCLRAMEKEPKNRLGSALEFVRELEDYLNGARKRRESEEITASVVSELRISDPGYTELADFDSQLIRAEGLWPENGEAVLLRQRVVERYARKALEHGDLLLAEIQAKRLASEEIRGPLLADVEKKRAELSRTRRQRTAFLGTALVVTALLLGLGVKYTLDQKRAGEEISAQRDRANRARLDAEGLIAFMLGDLKKRLDPIGRLDVLNDVGGRALKYFDTLPESDRSSTALARRAEALRQVAEVRLDQGDGSGAAGLLAEARGITRELLRRDPQSADWLRLEADVRVTDSAVLRNEGKLADALLEANGGTRTLEKLLPAAKAPLLFASLLRAYGQTALLKRLSGNLDGALEESERSADLASKLLAPEPQNPEWLDALAKSHGRMGGVHRMKGDTERALTEYAECGKILARRLSLDPSDSTVKAEIALNYSHQGAVLVAAGRLDEALAANREHLTRMQELTGMDPGNSSWQVEEGVGHATIARVLRARGDLQGAAAELREEERILRGLLRRNPKNPAWKRGLGVNLLAQASTSFLARETARARSLAEAAAPLVREAADRAPSDQQARRFLGQLLLLEGRIAGVEGNPARARERVEQAVEVLEPLLERSRDPLFVVPYAQALVLLGRQEEARPLVEAVVAGGFSDRNEIEFFREHGVLRKP